MKILLADDEPKVAEPVRLTLTAEGYVVDVATNGDEALTMAEKNPYDALLLDVTMPGRDGFAVVQELRRKKNLTPVIFLTGLHNEQDKIHGLDAGGDDYLTKPFSARELLARLRAVLRRQRPQKSNVLRLADLELDLVAHEARRAGERIELTRREFALLEFLFNASPNPMSKAAIVEHIWSKDFDSETNVVNVYINLLRRKIDRPGWRPLIHTKRGKGFALWEDKP
jgi:DNA-binding response OmpR family regulator